VASADSMCESVVAETALQAGAVILATAAVVQQPVTENATVILQKGKKQEKQQ